MLIIFVFWLLFWFWPHLRLTTIADVQANLTLTKQLEMNSQDQVWNMFWCSKIKEDFKGLVPQLQDRSFASRSRCSGQVWQISSLAFLERAPRSEAWFASFLTKVHCSKRLSRIHCYAKQELCWEDRQAFWLMSSRRRRRSRCLVTDKMV